MCHFCQPPSYHFLQSFFLQSFIICSLLHVACLFTYVFYLPISVSALLSLFFSTIYLLSHAVLMTPFTIWAHRGPYRLL